MADMQPEQKLKVFVSYSRVNTAFADELVAGLRYDSRFDVTIDRQSIIEGEDWKLRLGALIADADTVVFVLSPASAKSEICGWEVSEAKRLSKRILPVLAEPVGKVKVPEALAALNYVRFDPQDNGEPRSFMAGLKALSRALNTDVQWLREHTRYLTLAQSWVDAGRSSNRLLSGPDVAAAKGWAAQRPKDAPEVMDLHLEYFRASEEAEAAEASKERQQLAEIATAQKAREEALSSLQNAVKEKQDAIARLYRRTLIAGGIVALLTGGALSSIYLAANARGTANLAIKAASTAKENALAAQTKLVDTEKALAIARRIFTISDSNKKYKPLALRRICTQAVNVVSQLAITDDKEKFNTARNTFYEYYYGDMLLVEEYQRWKGDGTSKIQEAMVSFGRALPEDGPPPNPKIRKNLCALANDVRDQCNAFLEMKAPGHCP